MGTTSRMKEKESTDMQAETEREPETEREYWNKVLLAGGFTAVPRWTPDPGTGTVRHGIAQYEATIPDDLVAAVRRLAGELRISYRSVLLAAHAKVLAALSCEREVTTGYAVVRGGRPLPCRLTTEPDSWRAMLLRTHRAESELRSHRNFPVSSLRRELGLTQPPFETVFDPTGDLGPAEGPDPTARLDPSGDFDPSGDLDPSGDAVPSGDVELIGDDGEPTADTVLQVSVARTYGRHMLRLRYRTGVLDAGAAARIAGYHLTALAQLTADPDAEHRRQSLLSPEELEFQLERLAGPRRELPELRVHELFEQRVRADPDAVAAVHGDRQWTYAELNAHANRLGRALLAQGLPREGTVAVVTERNLDWLAAVLAIFKAGGVYLPLEPHFPADRIAKALSRAECRLVLTDPAGTATLDQALQTLPGVRPLVIREAYSQDHAESDLEVEVRPDQLAYVLFTSGSTGEPKGAMCEHAGMLNHLYAKIRDLEIGEGEVIPQTGPQCFDISVWQLLAALLVGGRTLLVEQEVILDVERLVDKIAGSRAGVLQVVPSYLEAIVSYLEQHPRRLPDLHTVSPTGDFLKKELTQRWFAVQPGIKLVNTYGLTETSDDAVHEVMDRPPDGDRVPLGRPIINVRVYVVDEHLSPVPLGAPGMIAFSGVCVGRGYVNDPERTRLMFTADPFRDGQRLCRTGDYGRWRPDGRLDFLGRRDSQVKIRGFRIEIGEIENALLGVPGVRDGAVVVLSGADRGARLVSFYSGPQPLDGEVLRDQLGKTVPEYMIPSTFHWREVLPLTANGKIDRTRLTSLAREIHDDLTDDAADPPSTPTERWLAAAWAKVLGVEPERIGRHDHFFDLGGTSMTAVRLAITVGRAVSLRDLTSHPVLADLAGLVDGRREQPSGLLQSLSEPRPQPHGGRPDALVCFPYAGGNAVNFQQLAGALRDAALAVYAVELPGHDLATETEPFAPLAQVVEQVVTDIIRRDHPRVLLWGHSAGAAFAVATARALTARGVSVRRVFLAAQLAGDAARRRAAIGELARWSNTEIAAALGVDNSQAEFDVPDAPRAEHLGAAYRHDCVSAHRYLAEALGTPPEPKLSVPVTVVVAADDPNTMGYQVRYRDWEALAEHVDLHELADGGHYFLRSRPAETARIVRQAAGLSSPSPDTRLLLTPAFS
jgi:amino acid adenylation domain-containing protein